MYCFFVGLVNFCTDLCNKQKYVYIGFSFGPKVPLVLFLGLSVVQIAIIMLYNRLCPWLQHP
jgi:hypothetical protein